MIPMRDGSIKLFRFAGVDVFLHWSWFVAAVIVLKMRSEAYSSLLWNVLEYLALFAIVLMHEFGHSLACRQVGGQADKIVLWPLGGIAYVAPPPRAGATLWSIAAGPLVNVILAPILFVLLLVGSSMGWHSSFPNLFEFLRTVSFINLGLLIFNMLPVFPLDGGQILRSLLWFPFGQARSLMITTVIGFLGVAALLLFALKSGSIWLGVLSVFIAMQCWRGFQQAQAMMQIDKLPRHSGFACPECRSAPRAGAFWLCGQCRQPFDTFASQSFCPRCTARYDMTQCADCGKSYPMGQWITGPSTPPPVAR